jgi:hypothetical protein
MKESKKRKGLTETSSDQIFDKIAGLIEKARQNIATTINEEMVILYWNIGRTIKEEDNKIKTSRIWRKNSAITDCTINPKVRKRIFQEKPLEYDKTIRRVSNSPITAWRI